MTAHAYRLEAPTEPMGVASNLHDLGFTHDHDRGVMVRTVAAGDLDAAKAQADAVVAHLQRRVVVVPLEEAAIIAVLRMALWAMEQHTRRDGGFNPWRADGFSADEGLICARTPRGILALPGTGWSHDDAEDATPHEYVIPQDELHAQWRQARETLRRLVTAPLRADVKTAFADRTSWVSVGGEAVVLVGDTYMLGDHGRRQTADQAELAALQRMNTALVCREMNDDLKEAERR